MAPNPYRVRKIAQRNPYGNFKKVRRLHSNGKFSRRYLFGGKKLLANRTHLAKPHHRRHVFGGKIYADYTRAGKFRLPQNKIRKIYSHHLGHEFRGNVRDQSVARGSGSSRPWTG